MIEESVRNKDLNAATGLVLDLLKQGAYPIPRVFRFYIGQVSASGDIDTIKSLEPFLSLVSWKKKFIKITHSMLTYYVLILIILIITGLKEKY